MSSIQRKWATCDHCNKTQFTCDYCTNSDYTCESKNQKDCEITWEHHILPQFWPGFCAIQHWLFVFWQMLWPKATDRWQQSCHCMGHQEQHGESVSCTRTVLYVNWRSWSCQHLWTTYPTLWATASSPGNAFYKEVRYQIVKTSYRWEGASISYWRKAKTDTAVVRRYRKKHNNTYCATEGTVVVLYTILYTICYIHNLALRNWRISASDVTREFSVEIGKILHEVNLHSQLTSGKPLRPKQHKRKKEHEKKYWQRILWSDQINRNSDWVRCGPAHIEWTA